MAMMAKTEYRIAQMKLQELRQQRSQLFQTYTRLEQRVGQASDRVQQLQTLFTGLQEVKMAAIELHPDVANLEPLLKGPRYSDETVSFWRTQLTKELAQGRLRSDLTYHFGALLEEWVQEKSQEMAPDPAGIAAYEQFLELARHPTEFTLDYALLDAIFADRNFMRKEDIATGFQQTAGNILHDRITTAEVSAVLEQLQVRPEHPPAIRRQAKSLAQDKAMCKEMADALSIYLTHLDEWDWPEEGVDGFPLWVMSKWRLFISYDLFSMCFLEILGIRLKGVFQSFLFAESGVREDDLRKFLAEPARDGVEGQVEQALHLYRLARPDIWKDLLTYQDVSPEQILELTKEPFYNMYGSVGNFRRCVRSKLQEASTTLSGYETHHALDGMKSALQLINAEIELTRAVLPEAPIYVLKLDLQAFYPTLSHELLLALLERYGFPVGDLAFFRKFLQVRIRHDKEQISFQRGVPVLHCFSNVLGEMVLDLMDQHILRRAHVQIIRMVDDICILTSEKEGILQAWQAAQEFCQGMGLTLNAEKCGAVCIQGELPDSLPTSLPHWQLMQLDASGAWHVDMEAFAKDHQLARQQVLQSPSLLSQIEVYNYYVQHLVRATAMELDLGQRHRQSIEQVAATFHQDFFGAGYGMLEALRTTIQERFSENDKDLAVILPEAWFHWPITAGGCGLTQMMLLASGYAQTYAAKKERQLPAKRPVAWQRDKEWVFFYESFIWRVQLQAPQATTSMEILVDDFIRRSNEMGNTAQTQLGPYWRWILYIYGPQILEYLGSFRFLSTELVPLQIILQHYQHMQDSDDDTNF